MAQLSSTAAQIDSAVTAAKTDRKGSAEGSLETQPVPFSDLPAGVTFGFTNGSAVVTLNNAPGGFNFAAWRAANQHPIYGTLNVYFLVGGAWVAKDILNVAGSPGLVNYNPWSLATGAYTPYKLPGSSATGRSARATGEGTLASGVNSNASGAGGQATGENADAGGYYTQATGYATFARGNGARATGNNATAFGSQTLSSGNNTFAAGEYGRARLGYGFGFGNAGAFAVQHIEYGGPESTPNGTPTFFESNKLHYPVLPDSILRLSGMVVARRTDSSQVQSGTFVAVVRRAADPADPVIVSQVWTWDDGATPIGTAALVIDAATDTVRVRTTIPANTDAPALWGYVIRGVEHYKAF
jgi:hypothetical protein